MVGVAGGGGLDVLVELGAREALQSLTASVDRCCTSQIYRSESGADTERSYSCCPCCSIVRLTELGPLSLTIVRLTELDRRHRTPSALQLRSMLLDPAINLLFQSMKKQAAEFEAKADEAHGELSAWKFTPDSQTGKRLMAKCRLLYQDENEELGKQITSGRIAKLEGDLALQKSLTHEDEGRARTLYEYLLESDDGMEGMQSTILMFKQQLRDVQTQLNAAVAENQRLLLRQQQRGDAAVATATRDDDDDARTNDELDGGAPDARTDVQTDGGAPDARRDVQTDGGAPNMQTDGGSPNAQTDSGPADMQTNSGAPNMQTDGGATDMQTDGGSPDSRTDGGAPNARTDGGAPSVRTDGGAPDMRTDGGAPDVRTDGGAPGVRTDDAAESPTMPQTTEAATLAAAAPPALNPGEMAASPDSDERTTQQGAPAADAMDDDAERPLATAAADDAAANPTQRAAADSNDEIRTLESPAEDHQGAPAPADDHRRAARPAEHDDARESTPEQENARSGSRTPEPRGSPGTPPPSTRTTDDAAEGATDPAADRERCHDDDDAETDDALPRYVHKKMAHSSRMLHVAAATTTNDTARADGADARRTTDDDAVAAATARERERSPCNHRTEGGAGAAVAAETPGQLAAKALAVPSALPPRRVGPRPRRRKPSPNATIRADSELPNHM
ncbi:PREDICTED: LOW QUALITY PROTEIN: coiled-coil domain-containing protein 8 homolog [Priapulus caudatus]|uniref:LOW QUALITY PROTEIN: coiled-coil domain-containing protein 8 homolog n=1 Tax=Priapulus caudatus TaxID=37621 RepID=A0ABM1F406_PRICU|nr:PREDICTED: LOW QUALITY PROTEIN: coiled-coil domain-containing protein 8 homolog [Priapulus caudatus]